MVLGDQNFVMQDMHGVGALVSTSVIGAKTAGKGTPPPSRDVPARIALTRISNVVNPIVEVYDKLASAAKIMSSGAGSKKNAEVTVHIKEGVIAGFQETMVQQQEGNEVVYKGTSTGVKEVKVPYKEDESEKLALDAVGRADLAA
ncbi:hypothetical protein A4A49_22215 [Nicotiana attenuata]|uniref:Uncharacterized protein n=1 Tax=Nicotiana attenuata TaxID=49451 RepID=A0A1J6IKW7_NICAT|nr:hypothetical protein A4A49_22215 [Nicotiana attenuata]